MADVSKNLKDAAYAVVGLGVMAFQKSQVRRVELTQQFESQLKQVESQATDARAQLAKLVTGVEERWEPVIKQLEARLTEIEERLPEQAAVVMKQTRAVAKDVQSEITNLISRPGTAA